MVKIVELEADIAVAPQLVAADFADVAARGFRSVVSNRPDGEAPGQLPSEQAETAAHRHGLVFRHLPVKNGNVTDGDVVAAFARLMNDLPAPILFYCGSGTRCTILWTQATAPRLGIDTVLTITRNAGCDLDFLRDTLEEQADLLRAATTAPSAAAALATPAE